MRAGVGRADITPPVGIPAGGWGNQYHEVSAGNDLELWATVLVVEGDDGIRAALADVDLCILDDAQAARARAVIADAAGVPEAHVAVGTTHNHSVPVTLELGGAWIRRNRELVAPYVESLFEALGRAASQAAAALRQVRVGAATGTSPLAVNRRMTRPDGSAAVGLNRDGIADHTVTVVRLDGDDDRPVATIAHYACHPIILGARQQHVTPEYPGIVKRVVEQSSAATACSCRALAATSAPARSSWRSSVVYRRLGAMLGHEAAAVALRASWRRHRQQLRPGEASAWIASFEYEPDVEPDATVAVEPPAPPAAAARRPRRHGPLERRGAAVGGRGVRGARRRRTAHRGARAHGADEFARMRAERGRALAGLDAYPLLVHGLRLGPVALVGVPVELFGEVGTAIRRCLAVRRDARLRLLERLPQLPADGCRTCARRVRDRHLAVPPGRRHARLRRRRTCPGRAALNEVALIVGAAGGIGPPSPSTCSRRTRRCPAAWST